MDQRINTIITDNNRLESNLIHNIDKKYLLIFNKELAKFDLTFQQSLVLLFISKQNQAVYQKDIEKYMGLKNPSVTSLIKSLVSRDFIYRVKDEKDGRYFHLHLTPKSTEILDDIISVFYRINEKIGGILSKEEQTTFITLLEKLSDGLDALVK